MFHINLMRIYSCNLCSASCNGASFLSGFSKKDHIIAVTTFEQHNIVSIWRQVRLSVAKRWDLQKIYFVYEIKNKKLKQCLSIKSQFLLSLSSAYTEHPHCRTRRKYNWWKCVTGWNVSLPEGARTVIWKQRSSAKRGDGTIRNGNRSKERRRMMRINKAEEREWLKNT
jgi:hypothetical protein